MNATKLAEILNVGVTFQYEGKTYTFKEATFTQRAEFSEWVQEQAIQFHKRKKEKGLITEAEYTATLAELAKDSFAFDFEGEACLRALNTPPGAKMFIYFMLRTEHGEVTEETAEGIYNAKVAVVIDAIKRVRNDPKALEELETLIVGPKFFNSSKTAPKTRSQSKSRGTKRRRK